MASFIPNRDSALTVLKEYVQTDSLIGHALAVEAVMSHFAKLFDLCG